LKKQKHKQLQERTIFYQKSKKFKNKEGIEEAPEEMSVIKMM